MSEQRLTTDWMWRADDGAVWGLSLNLGRQVVEWSDAIGCACSGGFAEQTFADFVEKGPRFGNPPENVVAEALETLRRVDQPD